MDVQLSKGPGSRALLAAVIGMGVLLVVGSLVLVGVLVHRISHPHPAPGLPEADHAAAGLAAAWPFEGPHGQLTLNEPPGTHITGMTRQGDGLLAVSLSGGGPDRVILWDLAHARVAARLVLTP
ncbi:MULTISPECIES: hypothetical protein [Nguyenibacter]|uniref:WD40 repeat domain-containing protein n=1 Tax=Nguyenibacter vanlangensis TaxID=1216886 RepID=A0ABZ3D7U0_9PROT|nr:hypothetical protein [Nguyenibacter sp. L1]WRH88490.1 hypothetical protein QN315_02315 [Nguyenibacter sp. L1]